MPTDRQASDAQVDNTLQREDTPVASSPAMGAPQFHVEGAGFRLMQGMDGALYIRVESGDIVSGAIASGAVAAGAFATGALVDGADLTQGALADTAARTGSKSVIALLKGLNLGMKEVGTDTDDYALAVGGQDGTNIRTLLTSAAGAVRPAWGFGASAVASAILGLDTSTQTVHITCASGYIYEIQDWKLMCETPDGAASSGNVWVQIAHTGGVQVQWLAPWNKKIEVCNGLPVTANVVTLMYNAVDSTTTAPAESSYLPFMVPRILIAHDATYLRFLFADSLNAVCNMEYDIETVGLLHDELA